MKTDTAQYPTPCREITESESAAYDGPTPTETQPAWHAVVHIVVPGTCNGEPVTEAGAMDWISETLRDQFLDWGYVAGQGDPSAIVVCKPYIEGTFLDD